MPNNIAYQDNILNQPFKWISLKVDLPHGSNNTETCARGE
jgi:hypothetical protein